MRDGLDVEGGESLLHGEAMYWKASRREVQVVWAWVGQDVGGKKTSTSNWLTSVENVTPSGSTCYSTEQEHNATYSKAIHIKYGRRQDTSHGVAIHPALPDDVRKVIKS